MLKTINMVNQVETHPFRQNAEAHEFMTIVTISPIIKNMTEHSVEGDEKALYKLALRNATFADAMAVFGSQLIPWHAYMAFFIGITYAVYPMDLE